MTSLIPERIVELPLEMQCQIISNIHDVPTIARFLASSNVTLVELTRQCIREIILEPGELLPVYIIRQLINLEKVTGEFYIDPAELRWVALLPRLTKAGFIIPPVNIYSEFLDICKQFVTRYCRGTFTYTDIEEQTRMYQNLRNFNNSNFVILSSSDDPGKVIMFYPSGSYPVIHSAFTPADLPGFSSLGMLSVDQLIDFISNYQRYTAIFGFDDRWLRPLFNFPMLVGDQTLPVVDQNKLVEAISSLPELTDLSLNYDPAYFNVTLSLMTRIFRSAAHKIESIGYEDITFVHYFNLEELPDSQILSAFTIPIWIDQVPQVLQKYPNNRGIKIYGWNRQADLKDTSQPLSPQQLIELSNIPNYVGVIVITPNPELIPKNLPKLIPVPIEL